MFLSQLSEMAIYHRLCLLIGYGDNTLRVFKFI